MDLSSFKTGLSSLVDAAVDSMTTGTIDRDRVGVDEGPRTATVDDLTASMLRNDLSMAICNSSFEEACSEPWVDTFSYPNDLVYPASHFARSPQRKPTEQHSPSCVEVNYDGITSTVIGLGSPDALAVVCSPRPEQTSERSKLLFRRRRRRKVLAA